VPLIVQIAGGVAILLVVAALVNLVYHVIHKPTELFAFIGHRLDREPAETWRQYGPLFRTYWPRWRSQDGSSEAIPINYRS